MNLQEPGIETPIHREPRSLLRAVTRVAAFCFSLAAFPLIALATPQAKREPDNARSGNVAVASVQHVQILLDKGAPAVEILTTMPVTPQISKSDDAMRMVIDLPNTNMSVPEKVVPIKNKDLGTLRLSLRNTSPPTVHVEVDFRMPLYYRWDSAGNRLLINFHEIHKDDTSAASAVPAATPKPLPVSATADAADFTHLVPAEQLAPGASVTANDDTVVLRLKRAGDVYVCPQTAVSVVQSKNGPDVTLAMNSGGVETHLALKSSAEEVVTPDFRILLRGPGEFHYAIRADSRGNTCVKTLPGNTASAIIYELMGDGKYQAQTSDQVVFHDGKLGPANVSHEAVVAVECGCPPPSRPTLPAFNKPENEIAVGNPSSDRSGSPEVRPDPAPAVAKNPVAAGALAPPDAGLEIPELPASVRQQPHTQIEASLAFTPNPSEMAARHMPATSRQLPSTLSALPPLPPQEKAPEERRGVFGKIKTFFSRVFR